MKICPMCGKQPHVYAIHGKRKILSCLNCGQGWESRVNGVTTKKFIDIDFSDLVRAITVKIGKREVKLQPIKIA
jgi:transcription elongation factor Elf1